MCIVLHGDNLKITCQTAFQPSFPIYHPCQLSDCQSMNNRNRVHSNKRFEFRFPDWAIDIMPIWVRSVKNHHFYFIFCASLHHVVHGTDVGIKPGAHILYIKDHQIQPSEHFGSRLPVFSINRNYRNSCFRIDFIIDLFTCVSFTSKSMLWGKYFLNRNSFLQKKIN